MERIVTHGLVLRTTDTKEADMLLTVLSAEYGRLRVIAKGARSRRSKIAAACQMLVYSEFTLTQKGEWYYINEASTAELFSGVRQDIEKLALGAYFAELTDALSDGDTSQTLPLLLNALYALGTLDKPQSVVRCGFVWRLMLLGGFAPLLDGCAVCGKEPLFPQLDVLHGVIHCAACKTDGMSMPLGDGALSALRYLLDCDARRLYHFTLCDSELRLLNHAAEAFVSVQLERSFRTLDYYKSLTEVTP